MAIFMIYYRVFQLNHRIPYLNLSCENLSNWHVINNIALTVLANLISNWNFPTLRQLHESFHDANSKVIFVFSSLNLGISTSPDPWARWSSFGLWSGCQCHWWMPVSWAVLYQVCHHVVSDTYPQSLSVIGWNISAKTALKPFTVRNMLMSQTRVVWFDAMMIRLWLQTLAPRGGHVLTKQTQMLSALENSRYP